MCLTRSTSCGYVVSRSSSNFTCPWPPRSLTNAAPATFLGNDRVDQALGLAATAGRFADDDVLSILGHIADGKPAGEVVRAGEAHSVQSGTIGWQALGQPPHVPRELMAD